MGLIRRCEPRCPTVLTRSRSSTRMDCVRIVVKRRRQSAVDCDCYATVRKLLRPSREPARLFVVFCVRGSSRSRSVSLRRRRCAVRSERHLLLACLGIMVPRQRSREPGSDAYGLVLDDGKNVEPGQDSRIPIRRGGLPNGSPCIYWNPSSRRFFRRPQGRPGPDLYSDAVSAVGRRPFRATRCFTVTELHRAALVLVCDGEPRAVL